MEIELDEDLKKDSFANGLGGDNKDNTDSDENTDSGSDSSKDSNEEGDESSDKETDKSETNVDDKETEDKDKSDSANKKDKEDKSGSSDESKQYSPAELLAELDEANDSLEITEDVIDNIEKNGQASEKEISILKEEINRMKESYSILEKQLRKTSTEKADLTLKNAELEAFGGEFSSPKLLIVSKNYDKATGGDDKAKSKVTSILKDMLEELTGEDFSDSKKDILGIAEQYNSKSNLKLPSSKDKVEDEGMSW